MLMTIAMVAVGAAAVCCALVVFAFLPTILSILVFAMQVPVLVFGLIFSPFLQGGNSMPEHVVPGECGAVGASFGVIGWLIELIVFLPRFALQVLYMSLTLPFSSPAAWPTAEALSSTKATPFPPPIEKTSTKTTSTFECMECGQAVTSTIPCTKCAYASCVSCYRAHLASSIERHETTLRCARCAAAIDTSFLQAHLSPNQQATLAAVQACDRVMTCPDSTCLGRLRLSSLIKRKRVCTRCAAAWCADCRRPFHLFGSCVE
ncbi:Aste57867_12496 [Aphanomyces stellatus]|uniref:Aste57867_12496 protein n=1 Tax=Aphanomyces stellatus TaxID=120398 RepID=A0A485KVS9_9STRA|nr:hypothetical protein As57867_012450 [Aphanomyces stellatus]VFT89347.1 Aste57867_12496 [Aphanomyces stellatus]